MYMLQALPMASSSKHIRLTSPTHDIMLVAIQCVSVDDADNIILVREFEKLELIEHIPCVP